MSIPRLALMGALTGIRLTLQISRALEIHMGKATFWVDRANVSFWVQGQSRNYKPFVSHRVEEIKTIQVQISRGTFQLNLTLLMKELRESLFKT